MNQSTPINIAHLCTFYASSISKWEAGSNGHPLDGTCEVIDNRYSCHTDQESGAFIVFELPCDAHVKSIEIILRNQYTEKQLPYSISVYREGGWVFVQEISENKPVVTVGLNDMASAVKIEKNGFGAVFLSAVNIYQEAEDFKLTVSRIRSKSEAIIYAETSFYGLGGKLSVIASALGYTALNTSNKNLVCDATLEHLVAYPPSLDLRKDSNDFLRMSRGLAPHLVRYLYDNRTGYHSEKNVSSFVEDKNQALTWQDRKAVYISRDSVMSYRNKEESRERCLQRLYKKIIPTQRVFDVLDEIVSKHGLGNKFEKSLGVHIRHGNGERYFNKASNTWGVKPPSRDEIVRSINTAISLGKSDVQYIVVCSDSFAIRDLVEEEFSRSYEVIFLSEDVRPIGLGCGHSNLTFVKMDCSPATVDDEIIPFAEILALANCKYLCGGLSYFFDAVVGFSDCSHSEIHYINNRDRYIKIESDSVPLVECDDQCALEVAGLLASSISHLDGLFIKLRGESVELSYFDVPLFAGTVSKINVPAILSIKKRLNELRLY